MMLCPGMVTEDAFLNALRNYESSSLQGGTLLLLGEAGEPVARFVAAPLPE
jgi:heat shock protein HslJ